MAGDRQQDFARPGPSQVAPAERPEQRLGEAAEKAKDIAGEAADRVEQATRDLRGEARERARAEVATRSTQAGERVGEIAPDVRAVGDTLRERGHESTAQVADEVANRVERAAGYLRDADFDRMIDDVADFGRRRPVLLAAAAAAVGVAATRFARASDPASPRDRDLLTANARGGDS